MQHRYEQIGRSYANTRREDPQIKACILAALGTAESVVNVGAGTGSYEPHERTVVAVEPSRIMNAQRTAAATCVLRATAEHLPLRDGCVDAALSVLSLHHWDEDRARGVRELRRVARDAVVIVTIDPIVSSAMWLMADYLPEVAQLDLRIFPAPEQIAAWLGGTTRIETLEISRDTPDWTLLSFWAHPERVLDARARESTSGFARMPPAVVARVVHDVERDLASGAWDARHGQLRTCQTYDAGLRLLVNRPEHGVPATAHSTATKTARASARHSRTR